jgi:hypothetical protein
MVPKHRKAEIEFLLLRRRCEEEMEQPGTLKENCAMRRELR